MQDPETPERPNEPEGPPEPREPETPERPGQPEENTGEQFRSAHSPRSWRACCLAPTVVLGVLLLFLVIAGVLTRADRPGNSVNVEATDAQREAFIEFGREYFAIAQQADRQNEAAFAELENFSRGDGDLERVHSVFEVAGMANSKAAEQFRALSIPSNLASREKIRSSLDVMAESYEARSRACAILADWNGDMEDRELTGKYRTEVESINKLTVEGLRQLGEAASDNGVGRDDIRRIVPGGAMRTNMFDTRVAPFKEIGR